MVTNRPQIRPSLRQEPVDLHRWHLKLISWPQDGGSHPVLLVPGHLCPHNFWFPAKRDGFGDWLSTHKFRPFALSEAPAAEQFAIHSRRTSDWVFHILPRSIEQIHRATGKAPHLIGYSAGAAYALACQALLRPSPKIASIVMVGTQVTIAQESRFLRGALRALGRLSMPIKGHWFGFATSDNSAAELSEYVDSKAGEGNINQPLMTLRDANSLKVDVPVLSVASAADEIAPLPGCYELFNRINAPEKSFIELKQSEDQPPVRHFELFARRHRTTVWPHLLSWLQHATD